MKKNDTMHCLWKNYFFLKVAFSLLVEVLDEVILYYLHIIYCTVFHFSQLHTYMTEGAKSKQRGKGHITQPFSNVLSYREKNPF